MDKDGLTCRLNRILNLPVDDKNAVEEARGVLSRTVLINDIDETAMDMVILLCCQSGKTIHSFNKNAAVKQLGIVFVNKQDADELLKTCAFSLGFRKYKITSPVSLNISDARNKLIISTTVPVPISTIDKVEMKMTNNGAETTILTTHPKHSVLDRNSDNSETLSRVHQTLCEFIRRLDPILSYLLVKKAISSEDHAAVLSNATTFQCASHLLDIISVKPATSFECFLEALDLTNQHHLHRFVTEKDYEMNSEHKTKLLDNFTYLKQNILLLGSTLLDNLLEVGVLDQQEVDEIRSKNTEHERINQLLHLIMRTSDKQYQQFLKALKMSDHQHVWINLSAKQPRTKIFTAAAFLHNPKMLRAQETDRPIWSMAVLGNTLFIVHQRQGNELSMYSANTFELIHTAKIADSILLSVIIACPQNNCLYMSDEIKLNIYRYDFQFKKVFESWSTTELCFGLSVTRNRTVLATLENHVHEYTPNGDLIRYIRVDNRLKNLYHCVQLSNEQFVLSYAYHRKGHSGSQWKSGVCIIDTTGSIVQSYCESAGAGIEPMKRPGYLTVDKYDNVIVADSANGIIVLLSPTLAHLGYVRIPEYQLCSPNTLHLDEVNRRFYIGETLMSFSGRLLVIEVDKGLF